MDCKWAATGRWVSRGNRKDNSVSLFPRVSQSTLSLCIKLSVEVSVRFHSPDSLCKLLCAYALELAQAPPSDESTMNLSFYFNLTFTVDWQFINLIISKKTCFGTLQLISTIDQNEDFQTVHELVSSSSKMTVALVPSTVDTIDLFERF